jgi:dolichol kinase
MALTKEEISRKYLHCFSGTLVPAVIFYLPFYGFATMRMVIILCAIFLAGSLILEFARVRVPAVQKMFYRYVGHMLRPEEKFKITGSTYIGAAVLLCSLLYHRHPDIIAMALCLFILGDAIAAIVGISIGRIKIGKKSLEGSLACFVLCLLMMVSVFPLVPHLLDRWSGYIPFKGALIVAFLVTVFELFPIKLSKTISINDNLTVPVVAGAAMLFLQKLL